MWGPTGDKILSKITLTKENMILILHLVVAIKKVCWPKEKRQLFLQSLILIKSI